MQKGKREPLFINGFLYKSFFKASVETGISCVSIWKAFKISRGRPATVKQNCIVTELWVQTRKAVIKMEYGL